VPTILLAFWMAWRYRASNTSAEYLPNWSYSGRIEAVVWAIPTLTIMFIGGVIWIGSYRLDPFRPLASPVPPLEIQVVALDWKWLFIYPQQGVATVNQLVVPAGRPGPLLDHLGQRVQRVLRAAAGLDDLRHAGHGLAG